MLRKFGSKVLNLNRRSTRSFATKVSKPRKVEIQTPSLSPAAIAKIKLKSKIESQRNASESLKTEAEVQTEPQNEILFELQGVAANNMLLLQFATQGQHDLALKLFGKIHKTADAAQFDQETFQIAVDCLINKSRSAQEQEDLVLYLDEMIERKYVKSVELLDQALATFWKTRNLAGIQVVFQSLQSPLEHLRDQLAALPRILELLDLAIEAENPFCCAAIYGVLLKLDVELPEETHQQLVRLWDAHTDAE